MKNYFVIAESDRYFSTIMIQNESLKIILGLIRQKFACLFKKMPAKKGNFSIDFELNRVVLR